MEANYGAGDTAMTPDGRGVVAAALTEEFEFPQESDAVVEVPANGDAPAYVVGLEAGGAAVYRDETIEPATFDNEGLPAFPDPRRPK